ncbi:hypothetical protein L207DRAFT_339102 [Hyaloscypha variabilis F]|uniref:Uncharacterized protein n=1 Tax=Hyaloscypha variabilis (strain UAMH 11265 / GT02V1 / F) TaxID=1149755 RepID=A0A2J6RPN8_HYAVF|nr:hypothetical protein L207DRAFT_339102 [Hyaloscypha variabilis F]
MESVVVADSLAHPGHRQRGTHLTLLAVRQHPQWFTHCKVRSGCVLGAVTTPSVGVIPRKTCWQKAAELNRDRTTRREASKDTICPLPAAGSAKPASSFPSSHLLYHQIKTEPLQTCGRTPHTHLLAFSVRALCRQTRTHSYIISSLSTV